MNCPACKDKALRAVLTRQGVEVDYCDQCKGVWLDRGEVFQFSKNPQQIGDILTQGLKQARPSERLSPRTNQPMQKAVIKPPGVEIDFCPQSGGLWFDANELKQLISSRIINNLELDSRVNEVIQAIPRPAPEQTLEVDSGAAQQKQLRLSSIAKGLTPLPNLFIRSAVVLVSLYAILILVLITCVEVGGLGPGMAVILGVGMILLHFAIGPFMMDISLRWLYRMSWVRPSELPQGLADFIRRVCKQKHMKFPRMGIIHDGSPNAFTYGHHPNNARIVITRGLLDLLDEPEAQAVVAHEIGHAKHWDMLLITLAQLVPLILYYVYRTLIRMRSRGRDRSAAARYAIAIGAYILYIISEYLVLWFSRTREYFADRFAGEVTGRPNDLASALVKIAYGLAGQGKKKGDKDSKRSANLEAIGALGIFDGKTARSLAIAGYNSAATPMGGEVDKDTVKNAMKWDFWNPWAKYYELHSTHPLTANRLNYLSEQSVSLGQKAYIVFDRRKPESYWDEFLVDILVMWLPLMLAIPFIVLLVSTGQLGFLGAMVTAIGLGSLIKVLFTYKANYFPRMNIAGLLKQVKVSAVRSVPCILQGTIIGRGIPGLIWSEDFVMQDETGIIFLDYRQPLGLWAWLFGLLRAGAYRNKPVTATGWYRRSPVPYIELKTMVVDGRTTTCYVYYVKLVFAILVILAGLFLVIWLLA